MCDFRDAKREIHKSQFRVYISRKRVYMDNDKHKFTYTCIFKSNVREHYIRYIYFFFCFEKYVRLGYIDKRNLN